MPCEPHSRLQVTVEAPGHSRRPEVVSWYLGIAQGVEGSLGVSKTPDPSLAKHEIHPRGEVTTTCSRRSPICILAAPSSVSWLPSRPLLPSSLSPRQLNMIRMQKQMPHLERMEKSPDLRVGRGGRSRPQCR